MVDEKGNYTAAVYERAIADAKEDAMYEFEERAAIMEYCGGMSRRDAEVAAAHWIAYGTLPPSREVPQ